MSKALRHYLFGHHRRNPVARTIARRAEKIVLAYKNFSYDLSKNGEEYILRDVMAPKKPRVLFDVGANNGEWSRIAARYCPDAKIHAFEIVPATADQCARDCAGFPQIILNRIGLSDSAGTIGVRSFANSTHSTILDYPHDEEFQMLQVPVTTGDEYVRANNIAEIDLLKMDVEGAENKVIQGFIECLRARKIRMIQLEYGRANILSKFLLKDWYDLLSPLGYRIGKLYPTYIDYKPYDLRDEDFIGPNYIAERID